MKANGKTLRTCFVLITLLMVACTPQQSLPTTPIVVTQLVEGEQIVVTQLVQGESVVVTATPEGPKDPIRIGVNMGLTGGGATSARNGLNGIRLALKEIEANGGLLGGRPIELYIQDNKCSADEGVAAANKLLFDDEVSAVIGATCSSVCLPIMPLHQEAGVPLVIGVCTSPRITEQSGVGGNEWIFRLDPPDNVFGAVGGKVLVEELGYQRIAALIRDDEFGRGLFAEFEKSLIASGGEIISVDYFKPQEPDFLPVLTAIQARNPDTILMATLPDDTLRIMQQYKELGLNIPVSGRGEYFSEALFNTVGIETMEGASSLDPWYVVDPSEESQAFVQKFKQEYGYEPVWQVLSPYVSMHVIADAIERAGTDDPAAIRDALETTSLPSILGQVEFDDHNQMRGYVYMAQLIDGVLTVIGRFPY